MQVGTYFPLNPEQKALLNAFVSCYAKWNKRLNLVSKNSLVDIVRQHILPSLFLLQQAKFRPNTRILDIGTGGGFPGLVMAIYAPYIHMTCCDSIGKKIRAIKQIAKT